MVGQDIHKEPDDEISQHLRPNQELYPAYTTSQT